MSDSIPMTLKAARLFIEECLRQGVRYYLAAPGSRNGSFLTVLGASDFKGCVLRHYDERGLGYVALGLSVATRTPVFIVTTSGTAAAALLPSVIEASKKKIPLIVVTADRPWILQATGANQTIDQTHLFGRYVRWFNEVPVSEDMPGRSILSLAAYSVWRSRRPVPGPVHINWRTPETPPPLKTLVAVSLKTMIRSQEASLQSWGRSSQPFCTYADAALTTEKRLLRKALVNLGKGKIGWIASGKLKDERERAAVLRLSEWLGWPVLPDITSGLRQYELKKGLVWTSFHLCLADETIRQQLLKHQNIETVLQVGGRMTAKAWDQTLQETPSLSITMALPHPLRHDPWHQVHQRLVATASQLWDAVKNLPSRVSAKTYRQRQRFYQALDDICWTTVDHSMKDDDAITEGRLARILAQTLPEKTIVFLGNSLPIRAADAFVPRWRVREVFANRGASGIDGQVASFYGILRGLNKPGVLFIGDLGLLYDVSSLSLFDETTNSALIVVVNNNGGGIFHQLPWEEIFANETIKELFLCPHDINFERIAASYNFDYLRTESAHKIRAAVRSWMKNPRLLMIEALVDPGLSVRQIKQLNRLCAKQLKSFLGSH